MMSLWFYGESSEHYKSLLCSYKTDTKAIAKYGILIIIILAKVIVSSSARLRSHFKLHNYGSKITYAFDIGIINTNSLVGVEIKRFIVIIKIGHKNGVAFVDG